MDDCVSLVLMICVCLIKPFHTLKDLNFNRMLEGHTFRTIPGVNFDECWSNCKQRPACRSINYKRKSHICQLNTGRQLLELTTQLCTIFREKQNSIALDTMDCGSSTCSKDKVCDYETKECKVKECIHTNTSDGVDISGNMASVGSVKIYSCKEGFMPSTGSVFTSVATCENNGWKHALECVPLTCKGLADIGETSSNMYKSYDDGSQRNIDIFCEFNNNTRIGYTFLSADTINPLVNISKYYTRTDHVMLRHVRNGEQYDSKMEVLPAYRDRYNVSLFNSEHPDFAAPATDVAEPYLYMAFVPNSYGDQTGKDMGYSCNGQAFTFTNKDNNKSNYFAIFDSPSLEKRCWPQGQVRNGWILCSTLVASTRHLPDAVFLNRYELHIGGGGCLVQTCPELNVQGTAFGMPFDY